MEKSTKFKQTEIGLIPEDWGMQTLGTLCEITSSKRIFLNEYVSDGIPFYRSKEIILLSNYQEIMNTLFISKVRYKDIVEKFGSPQEGDLLMTSVGTLGVPYIVQKNEIFYFKDGNLMWFKRFKKNLLKNKFLYYWIKSQVGQQQLDNVAIGSTQKALTINALQSMKLSLPLIQEQSAISKILSDLDSKIELNQRMNKTLEAIGQALFKHWFIDFEFPNEEGKPYRSSGGEMIYNEVLGKEIPKGWEVKSVSDITEHITTGLNPRDNFVLGKGNNYYITIKNMTDSQDIIFDDRCDKINDEALIKIYKRSKLKIGNILFSGIATIGRVFLIDESPDKWGLSESIFIFKADNNKVFTSIIYRILLNKELQFYAQQLASGSVQKGIRMADLKKFKVALPSIRDQKKYAEIFDTLIKKFKVNIHEKERSTQLRDSLLPKLMSGKIRVPVEVK
jgi:type I restriction enzyme, S subunit